MLTADQLNANPLPFAKLMGVRFVSVSKDEIVAELKVRDDLCTAPMPILHGGAAMALADTAGAVATFLNLPEGAKGTTTIESKTNFLAAAQSGHDRACNDDAGSSRRQDAGLADTDHARRRQAGRARDPDANGALAAAKARLDERFGVLQNAGAPAPAPKEGREDLEVADARIDLGFGLRACRAESAAAKLMLACRPTMRSRAPCSNSIGGASAFTSLIGRAACGASRDAAKMSLTPGPLQRIERVGTGKTDNAFDCRRLKAMTRADTTGSSASSVEICAPAECPITNKRDEFPPSSAA